MVPVNRERTDLDMIDVRCVGFNAFSVAQHGEEKPPKSEDPYQYAPKHELIIENGKHRIFGYHATTPIDRPHTPPLSVCRRWFRTDLLCPTPLAWSPRVFRDFFAVKLNDFFTSFGLIFSKDAMLLEPPAKRLGCERRLLPHFNLRRFRACRH